MVLCEFVFKGTLPYFIVAEVELHGWVARVVKGEVNVFPQILKLKGVGGSKIK